MDESPNDDTQFRRRSRHERKKKHNIYLLQSPTMPDSLGFVAMFHCISARMSLECHGQCLAAAWHLQWKPSRRYSELITHFTRAATSISTLTTCNRVPSGKENHRRVNIRSRKHANCLDVTKKFESLSTFKQHGRFLVHTRVNRFESNRLLEISIHSPYRFQFVRELERTLWKTTDVIFQLSK